MAIRLTGIPLGAKPPVSNMILKIVYSLLILLAIVVICAIIYPPMLILVEIGTFILAIAICITIFLGFYDSAREGLDAAEKERTSGL